MVTLLRYFQLNAHHVTGSFFIKTKSSMEKWKLFSSLLNSHHCSLISVWVTQAAKIWFTCSFVTFANILPHSLTLPEAVATGDQMKSAVTFSRFMDFSGLNIVGNIGDDVRSSLAGISDRKLYLQTYSK